jgi:hypothetical protein
MLDKKLNAYLLEINQSPSLNMNFETGAFHEKVSEPSVIDIKIKRPLVTLAIEYASMIRQGKDIEENELLQSVFTSEENS